MIYYDYIWFPGGQITPNISGLSNGTYSVLVTDQINLNCAVTSLSITISCPDTCILNLSATDTCGFFCPNSYLSYELYDFINRRKTRRGY